MTDADIDFYTVIAKTWTPDEAEGWTAYAVRVETGAVPTPPLTPPITPRTWLEDWRERGRPVDGQRGAAEQALVDTHND